MKLRRLPPEAARLLRNAGASPRLVAHSRLVFDVAATLCDELQGLWPRLAFDKEVVLFGAATHDIGKALHPQELTEPGHAHEEAGFALLTSIGVATERARFARTHASWAQQDAAGLDDLLVALADKIWKGKREEALEMRVAERITIIAGEERWSVYSRLDTLLMALAEDADERLAWQNRHAI